MADLCGEFCLLFNTNFLAWEYPGIGRNLFFLCLQSVVFFSLTLAVDFQLPQKLAYLCRGRSPPPPQGVTNPQDTGEVKVRVEVTGII